MGYSCPVCAVPQADGEHLAHHLAITAMLHGGPHEEWLAERVPDWAERDPPGLAAAVVEHARETDHEPVTTGEVHDDLLVDRVPVRDRDEPPLDPETRRVVEEARELTRRRRRDREE